jgi:agmatine deiminase
MGKTLKEQLQEIFELFRLVDIKGVPMSVSPHYPRIMVLIEEVLSIYGLPLDYDYERIFIEMVRHRDWDESVCNEAIANLDRSKLEYNSGHLDFKSILIEPKAILESRFVYIASDLLYKHLDFVNRLNDILLKQYPIITQFLYPTNDIWCRDFMPIPVSKDKFVQFVYDPDYLKGKWSHLKTDPWQVTESFDFTPIRSELVIDGGNVIKYGQTVIMTEKIFPENPIWDKPNLLKQISKELEVDKVVIIPVEPEDYTGHSDGMVRFVGEDSVIINDYLSEDGYSGKFITDLRYSLESRGIKIVGTLPYRSFPRKNKDGEYTAIGCYMNFLEMDNLILFPKFEIEEDEIAYKKIQEYFPLKKVIQLDCREIAENGGVMNCITWTI